MASARDTGSERDELLRSLDLGALIEELCASRGLRRKRSKWPCPNPAHEQTNLSPPVSIGPDRNGGGYEVWSCHGAGCGHGGTALDALVSAGRARSIGEAFGQLRGDGSLRYRWPPGRPPRSLAEPASPAARAGALDEVVRYVDECHARLLGDEGWEGRAWLRERGFTREELERNRVGFDPGLIKVFREKNKLPRPLHGGVTLPLFDEHGETVYVQARQLRLPKPKSPKYLNPRETWIGPSPRLSPIHGPSDVDRSLLVVSEGMLDGILTARHFDTWAKIGSRIADASVADQLARAAAGRPIVVIGDPDRGGRDGAEHLVALLRERALGGAAWTTPPTGDVNDLRNASPERFGATLRALVAEAAGRAREGPSAVSVPTQDPRAAGLLREKAEVDAELRRLTRESASFERQRRQWREALGQAEVRGDGDAMRRIGRQLDRVFPHQTELESAAARARALDQALAGTAPVVRLTSAAFPDDPGAATRWNGTHDAPARAGTSGVLTRSAGFDHES